MFLIEMPIDPHLWRISHGKMKDFPALQASDSSSGCLVDKGCWALDGRHGNTMADTSHGCFSMEM